VAASLFRLEKYSSNNSVLFSLNRNFAPQGKILSGLCYKQLHIYTYTHSDPYSMSKLLTGVACSRGLFFR